MIRSLIFALFHSAAWAASSLQLAPPFADHMVLPMRTPISIRGIAKPHCDIEVHFSGSAVHGKSGANGHWRVELPALPPSSTARDLIIQAGDDTHVIHDVLVGEVWMCSGQSNMDFPLEKAIGGKLEIQKAAEFPAIRILNRAGLHTSNRSYNAAERNRLNKKEFFQGSWQVASPTAVAGFSAVAWWAGKIIHQSKNIPIGLIDNSVGGCGTEAWIPREILASNPAFQNLLADDWLESPKISAWARGRAKQNIGNAGNADHPFRPGFLFDADVRNWRGFPLAGVMWYQGETNAEILDDEWNESILSALITGWRQMLEQPMLPFFMVQLPRIGGDDPLRKGWPSYRGVQATVARKTPNTHLIETIDLGWDRPDVHPPDKRPVGERLGKFIIKSTQPSP